MNSAIRVLFLALTAFVPAAPGADLAALVADRAAIERVYYEHRLGTKPPFEETLPAATLEKLVRADLKKEVVLKRTYGVEITPELVAAEVQRIDGTTRAPEILLELKKALGGDPVRFARSLARPIVAERVLRARFENDDALHLEVRKSGEAARAAAIAARTAGLELQKTALKAPPNAAFTETNWQLHSRPEGTAAPAPATAPVQTKESPKSTSYSIEATAQIAQVLGGGPEKAGSEREKAYLEDFPPDLQNLIRLQLKKPGDVSALVEMPNHFLILLALERTESSLRAASMSLPKRSYDDWLAGQPD